MRKYLIIATVLSFMLLAGILAFGFKSMSAMGRGEASTVPTLTMIKKSGQQALYEATEFVRPIFATFGISIDGSSKTDEVTRHLQQAGKAVDDAVKQIAK